MFTAKFEHNTYNTMHRNWDTIISMQIANNRSYDINWNIIHPWGFAIPRSKWGQHFLLMPHLIASVEQSCGQKVSSFEKQLFVTLPYNGRRAKLTAKESIIFDQYTMKRWQGVITYSYGVFSFTIPDNSCQWTLYLQPKMQWLWCDVSVKFIGTMLPDVALTR